ncbi:MAG: YncE family protein [Alistipes sp.]
MNRLMIHILSLAALALSAVACMDYGPSEAEPFDLQQRGLLVTCEGNFCYGNASLSLYIPAERRVENELFIRANGMNLGDVAQSIALHNGLAYIVVNNSGVVYVVDTRTFEVQRTITGLTSPRYIHFVDDKKAYITDLYDPHIAVVDLQNHRITRRISTNGHRSTEQMVQYGRYIFTNCWSNDHKILVVDSQTDALVDSIEVGRQPSSLALDRHNKLWTITDGAELYRIDAATRTVEQVFHFERGTFAARLALNGTRDTLYYINGAVWRMPVVADHLPYIPFLAENGTIYYGLTVDPVTSEVYVADAIDYVQPGMIYRFTPDGTEVDRFRVGITPGAFCFKPQNP